MGRLLIADGTPVARRVHANFTWGPRGRSSAATLPSLCPPRNILTAATEATPTTNFHPRPSLISSFPTTTTLTPERTPLQFPVEISLWSLQRNDGSKESQENRRQHQLASGPGDEVRQRCDIDFPPAISFPGRQRRGP